MAAADKRPYHASLINNAVTKSLTVHAFLNLRHNHEDMIKNTKANVYKSKEKLNYAKKYKKCLTKSKI